MARNIEKGAFRTPPRHQNHRRWVFCEGDHSKRSAIMYDCVEFDDYPGNIGLEHETAPASAEGGIESPLLL
jgi:hypothetical protein